eukprot:2150909-Amphidinium_carterae.1
MSRMLLCLSVVSLRFPLNVSKPLREKLAAPSDKNRNDTFASTPGQQEHGENLGNNTVEKIMQTC